jgi:hypothetical protein
MSPASYQTAPPRDGSPDNQRAGNGTRTRDPNLGKVVLYQLSYSRVPGILARALPTELRPHYIFAPAGKTGAKQHGKLVRAPTSVKHSVASAERFSGLEGFHHNEEKETGRAAVSRS